MHGSQQRIHFKKNSRKHSKNKLDKLDNRISVPYGRKVSALRAEKSKANFSFREANFSFRDRTVVWPSVARLDSPDRGKESLPRGMESFLRFFLSKTTHFSAIGMHFFFLWPHDTTIRSQNGHLWMPPVQTSFMDSPWGQITTFMHVPFLEDYRSRNHISFMDFPLIRRHLWMPP